MDITDYHAKYYAHELKKRRPAGDIEGLIPTLMSAQVDLNPHQVDAALFACKSPLSKGVLLADEVGLGKTIEAGIVLSQKWAERKKKLLIVVPASLRKQWHQELLEKFFLRSFILEAKSFNENIKKGIENPFQREEIVICSYHFARNQSELCGQIPWDLVVFDEAHRLRNVYKKTNKIARTLKETFKNTPKILLTATPLQNSLMELYGLSSFIDEYTFGNEASFKSQYSLRPELGEDSYTELKSRLALFCQRTLRKQVKEYVKYTKRIPITEYFIPNEEEQILYEKISNYLQRENLKALPSGQRQLITLVLRKLLASSTFAIHGALQKMIGRLEAVLVNNDKKEEQLLMELSEDFESFDDIKEEWENEADTALLSESDKKALEKEISELNEFYQLAISITENAKGKALLKALEIGFKKAKNLRAHEKVIIFTESRRTQEYLLGLLKTTQYAERIVLFNGSNNDLKSKAIYEKWKQENKNTARITESKTADIRSALVDYFKNTAQIMIATEAAAEGINLQFCSFIVNYDLPWNPQRIEQRIGRCHRYGQKHDVVVVNFLNRKNEADQRVFKLLAQKLKLFEGVFGASDDVLGSISSGVDFERRILEIYQKCRTSEEINKAFDSLQKDMLQPINKKMKNTREKLLTNFDEEVNEKLKICGKESKTFLEKHEKWLWKLTKLVLKNDADFRSKDYVFNLKKRPLGLNDISLGLYKIGKNEKDFHVYSHSHSLAKQVMNQAINKDIDRKRLIFYYEKGPKISALKKFIGQSGLLRLTKTTIKSLEEEDYLIFSAVTQEGKVLDSEQCSRLFSIPVQEFDLKNQIYSEKINALYEREKSNIKEKVSKRNLKNFDIEMGKLDFWEEDMKKALDQKLKDYDKNIKKIKKSFRKANSLSEKFKLQKQIDDMENKKDKEWREYEPSKIGIKNKKDKLINDMKSSVEPKITEKIVFEIEWELSK